MSSEENIREFERTLTRPAGRRSGWSAPGGGFFIWASWQTFAVSRMFVGIVVISAMGYFTILILEALERRFVPWAKH